MARAKNNEEYLQMLGDVYEESSQSIMRMVNSLRKRSARHTDAEIEERLDEYFEACMNSSVLPDLAGMALALGVSKATMEAWSRGYQCSTERRELIQRAYTTIEAAQFQAASRGTFNTLLFMFLAKSKYGYHEDGRVNGENSRVLVEQNSTVAEIEDRYSRVYDVALPSFGTVAEKDPIPVERVEGEVVFPDEAMGTETEESDGRGAEPGVGA